MRNYVLIQEELYRNGSVGLLLRCIKADEAMKMIVESHYGLCRLREAGEKMASVIQRHGLFWPSVIKDCIAMAKKCKACQMHGCIPRVPAAELHSIVNHGFSDDGCGRN